jgi:hypothetical protein
MLKRKLNYKKNITYHNLLNIQSDWLMNKSDNQSSVWENTSFRKNFQRKSQQKKFVQEIKRAEGDN